MPTFLRFCICECLVLRNQWITRTVLKKCFGNSQASLHYIWNYLHSSILFIRLSVCLSFCLWVGLSVSHSVYVSVCLFVCLSVGRSICLCNISVLLRPSVFCHCTKSCFLYLVHHDAPNTHPLLFVSSESYFWLWVNLKQLCSLDYDKNLSLSRPFRIISNILPVCINMLLIVN